MKQRLALAILVLSLGACSGSNAKEWNDSGVTLDAAGKYPEAAEAFGAAVRLAPGVPKYHYNLGLVYGRMRHYDQAEHEFRETLRLEPGHVDASRALSVTVSRIQARGMP